MMAGVPPFVGYASSPATASTAEYQAGAQQVYAQKMNAPIPSSNNQPCNQYPVSGVPPVPQISLASFPRPPQPGTMNNSSPSNTFYSPSAPVTAPFPPTASTQQISRMPTFPCATQTATSTMLNQQPMRTLTPSVSAASGDGSLPRSSLQGGGGGSVPFMAHTSNIQQTTLPNISTAAAASHHRSSISYNNNTPNHPPQMPPAMHMSTNRRPSTGAAAAAFNVAQPSFMPPTQYPSLQNQNTPPASSFPPTVPSSDLSKMNGQLSRATAPISQHHSQTFSNQQHINGVSCPSATTPAFNDMSHQLGMLGSHQQQSSRYVDLLQERNVLKLDDEDIAIDLPPSVCNPEARCSPNVFRCTFRSIPQSQELLKKSRLPFGLTLQPFRNMKSLNVISASIVRCRYCRTYINPYIYLPDSRHWKCNLCYGNNDLPDDFRWDPSSRTFAEPTRRPEIRNATVEFIAPSEYMLRPPQPAVYVFIMDVSQAAIESGYLYTFSEQLLITLEHLPGDDRTLIAFLAVDSSIHFFQFNAKSPPKQLIVDDHEDPFIPVNSGLLIEFRKNIDVVRTFVQSLPSLYESNSSPSNCLGAALNIARDLIKDIGGRITVLQTILPNLGPGALTSREDPNQRASSDVQNLGPATDFYKSLALECTGYQIAIDLFLLNTQYADLATLSEMAKFSSGCVHHYPGYRMNRNEIQVKRFQKQINRYLTRKIGFEAVLRIRCTRGLTLHTFYGNFFVRSTDLLAMANVNPDSAFGVQVQMEENLIGLSHVCFQAALLYTSSKGDRRIRVHTLCLPVTKDLPTVFSHFDVKCAVSMISKMAVERSMAGGNLSDSREAMVNAVVDALGAFNTTLGQGRLQSLLSPKTSIRLLPLYVLGMLKNCAFTAGRSVKLDDRVAALLLFKTAPLEVIELELYPALYKLNSLLESEEDPPRLHLSYEFIDRDGIYLMDAGSYSYVYVSSGAHPALLNGIFGVEQFTQIDEEAGLELLENSLSERVHGFLRKLFVERTLFAPIVVIREDGIMRELFTRRLVEDRTESSHSYIEFLQHLRQEIQR
ncbi:unnamed protein product [Anisakis simplex]|uniref:Protein transport protein Sec24B n=1 Tax=Anisakis simplex TaxID=6269 RepID=A0A0M3JR63_ANISI|nr:unnamed protein product [Anisakis simplex]